MQHLLVLASRDDLGVQHHAPLTRFVRLKC